MVRGVGLEELPILRKRVLESEGVSPLPRVSQNSRKDSSIFDIYSAYDSACSYSVTSVSGSPYSAIHELPASSLWYLLMSSRGTAQHT